MIQRSADEVSGFLFDPNQCTGCSACVLACSTENGLGWGTSWRHIVPFNGSRRWGVPSFSLSLACNHCDDAPCVEQCPAMAIRRESATGAVLIHEDACIGCRYCSWVCPFDAPVFDTARAVMAKCTLCHHRLVDGLEPACVNACPTSALDYGPLVGDATIPGFPETSAGPRIRFVTPRRDAAPPESTWEVPADLVAAFRGAEPCPDHRRLSLRAELPLWLFTTGAALLVGWTLAAVLGGVAIAGGLLLGLAGVSLAVSTLHLGRKRRAWRALVNVRRSRLSREVAAYGAFVGLAAVWLLLLPEVWAAGLITAGVGLVALFTMDRVYDPVRPAGDGPIHSADVVLTGPLVASAILQDPLAFGAVAALKGALVVRRAFRSGVRSPAGGAGALVRVVVGLVLPLLVWKLWPETGPGVGIVLVVAAELWDRGVFYEELQVPTPRSTASHRAATWAG